MIKYCAIKKNMLTWSSVFLTSEMSILWLSQVITNSYITAALREKDLLLLKRLYHKFPSAQGKNLTETENQQLVSEYPT